MPFFAHHLADGLSDNLSDQRLDPLVQPGVSLGVLLIDLLHRLGLLDLIVRSASDSESGLDGFGLFRKRPLRLLLLDLLQIQGLLEGRIVVGLSIAVAAGLDGHGPRAVNAVMSADGVSVLRRSVQMVHLRNRGGTRARPRLGHAFSPARIGRQVRGRGRRRQIGGGPRGRNRSQLDGGVFASHDG